MTTLEKAKEFWSNHLKTACGTDCKYPSHPDMLAEFADQISADDKAEIARLRTERKRLRIIARDADNLCFDISQLLMPDLTGAEADIREQAVRLVKKIDKLGG